MPENRPYTEAVNLEELAKAHFQRDFTTAEHNLLTSAPLGQMAYPVPQERRAELSIGPDKSEKSDGNPGWGPERDIAADLIRWMCIDRNAREQIDSQGIQLVGARIRGTLDLKFVDVPFPIWLQSCLILDEIWLYRVKIPALSLSGCWTHLINADRAVTEGSLVLGDGFYADGPVTLRGAQIGGDLYCDEGYFKNPKRHPLDQRSALEADSAHVGGYALMRGVRVWGKVSLLGAEIGRNLECDGSMFLNPDDDALDGEHIVVRGHVFLRKGFRASGTLRLVGAEIAGGINCVGGNFDEATLDVTNASASIIGDDRTSWPQPGRLNLDGFVYDRIAKGPKDAADRLRWLALQPDTPFSTQPYLQLAKVLKDAGDDDGSVAVLINMERRRRRVGENRLHQRALGWLFRVFAGYGYAPARSALAIIAVCILGFFVYQRSYLGGGIVPTDKDAASAFAASGQSPAGYERFSPLVYSLENSLPLVKLGQADKWHPDPDGTLLQKGKWIASARRLGAWALPFRPIERLLVFTGLLGPSNPKESPSRLSRAGTSPAFLTWFLRAQILLGWLLATLFVTGVTGVVRKD